MTLPSPKRIMSLGKNEAMPKGVYKHKKMSERSPEVQAVMRACLDKGRTPEVRSLVNAKLAENAKSFEWRLKVSQATEAAMHRPEIREKHLKKLAEHYYPNNFKHGNGQEPGPVVKSLAKKLLPLGFVMEFPVKTAGHGLKVNTPTSYKVDFGHPVRKVAVEVDGPQHRNLWHQLLDEKKTAVLNALGWTVARVKHK